MRSSKIKFYIFLLSFVFAIPNTFAQIVLRNGSAMLQQYPKDTCIHIYSINNNGYNNLIFSKLCNFDTEIDLIIWCKYILINKKNGERKICEQEAHLSPRELEKVVNSKADSLYEYGDILDYHVGPGDNVDWGGYYEAYTIDGHHMRQYDIEICYSSSTHKYFVHYRSDESGNAKNAQLYFSNPDEILFSLKGIRTRLARKIEVTDVTIQARITRGGDLKGTINTDNKLEGFCDSNGKVIQIFEQENCGNIPIYYEKTGWQNIIR